MSHSLVVAITGASGAVYARRLLEVLASQRQEVHLVVSPAGAMVLKQELGATLATETFELAQLWDGSPPDDLPSSDRVTRHGYRDFLAPIASGSHRTAGMVICPCSGNTLSAIATGASNNLIQRAADVHLKERRRLVLVPRETPLSLVHIDNMRKVVEAGAILLPASPGWYHGRVQTEDLIDFIVARILDQLGIEHALSRRWGSDERGLSPPRRERDGK
jgi:4-hydroxy-3-polyprenylbenzoate decarboxylase